MGSLRRMPLCIERQSSHELEYSFDYQEERLFDNCLLSSRHNETSQQQKGAPFPEA